MSMKKLLTQLPGSSKALMLLMAFSLADALLIAGQALALAYALTLLWQTSGLEAALPFAGIFALCFMSRQLVSLGRSRYISTYARTTAGNLLKKLSAHAYDAGAGAVQKRGTGSTAALFIEGVAQVENYLQLILPKLADLIMIPAILTVALFLCDPISGVIALVMLPCIVGYMRMLGAHAKEAAAKQHGTYQIMSNHFMDTLAGISTLKLLGASKGYEKQVFSISEKFRKATVRTLKTATLSSLILDLFRTGALAAIAIMLGFRLMSGDVSLFVGLSVLIMVPEYFAAVRRYSQDFHASLDGKNQLQSIMDYLDEPVVEAPRTQVTWNEDAVLTLKGLTYIYGEESAPALSNISLTIPAGAKVGIVGASGSGKSTLAHLIAGFASPTSGSLRINQDEVSTLAWDGWRSQVAYLPQQPHLFAGTLRENVAFYRPDASDSEILQAAAQVGLTSVLDQLNDGLDIAIGQGGQQLSGGQAQRVALARAFLDHRGILVFDEPTAHLDIETELSLSKDLLNIMDGKTVLMTTHRLYWMQQMDWLVVLEQGQVAQTGTYEDLIDQPGAFQNLVSQLKGGDAA